MDIVSENVAQGSLFDTIDHAKESKLMKALDAVNSYMGENVVQVASQGYSRKWKLRTDHISPCFTTRLDPIVKVKH